MNLSISIPSLTRFSVWIKVGLCTADSIINLALCCLGYLPGLLHSWYIILKNPEPDYDDPDGYAPVPTNEGRDVENGRVTYYYVSRNARAQPPGQNNRVYGTNDQSSQPQPAKPAPQPPHQPGAAGEGSSEARPPPTYAEAVKGDNKVQTDE